MLSVAPHGDLGGRYCYPYSTDEETEPEPLATGHKTRGCPGWVLRPALMPRPVPQDASPTTGMDGTVCS